MGSDLGHPRTVRRRLLLVLGGAALLLAASAPTRCTPVQKPVRTLYGSVTQGSRGAGAADATCPEVPGPGAGTIRGLREKWGARIAAADPKEWLSIRPCVSDGSTVVDSIDGGSFTIYTASGDVRGQVRGAIEDVGSSVSAFTVRLTITEGTKAYRKASGTLWFGGCVRGDGRITSGALGAGEPTGLVERCRPVIPDLQPTFGAVTRGSRGVGYEDPTCPEVPGPVDGTYRGLREKWGARIAAADPEEWLSIRPCSSYGSKAVTSLDPGPFILYTANGDLRGTAAGFIEDLTGEVYAFSVELTVEGGTKGFEHATGTLWFSGCVTSSGTIPVGDLGGSPPGNLFERCSPLAPGLAPS